MNFDPGNYPPVSQRIAIVVPKAGDTTARVFPLYDSGSADCDSAPVSKSRKINAPRPIYPALVRSSKVLCMIFSAPRDVGVERSDPQHLAEKRGGMSAAVQG